MTILFILILIILIFVILTFINVSTRQSSIVDSRSLSRDLIVNQKVINATTQEMNENSRVYMTNAPGYVYRNMPNPNYRNWQMINNQPSGFKMIAVSPNNQHIWGINGVDGTVWKFNVTMKKVQNYGFTIKNAQWLDLSDTTVICVSKKGTLYSCKVNANINDVGWKEIGSIRVAFNLEQALGLRMQSIAMNNQYNFINNGNGQIIKFGLDNNSNPNTQVVDLPAITNDTSMSVGDDYFITAQGKQVYIYPIDDIRLGTRNAFYLPDAQNIINVSIGKYSRVYFVQSSPGSNDWNLFSFDFVYNTNQINKLSTVSVTNYPGVGLQMCAA